jgi:hypothetical protein
MQGINFIEPLFYKAISGEKTQTRRIIKPQPMVIFEYDDDNQIEIINGNPPYELGEKLYLKEPYKIDIVQGGYTVTFGYSKKTIALPSTVTGDEIFKVWNIMMKSKTGYCNKMFTVKGLHEHMPHYIEITGVSAGQLQDISEEDCMKEGIKCCVGLSADIEYVSFEEIDSIPDYLEVWYSCGNVNHYDTPQKAYAALIDSISGNGTWESNPFVWIYDFKLTK